MLFQPFPALPRTAQLTLEAPLETTAVALTPRAALDRADAPATAVRLVARAGQPAYIVETPAGTVAIDARTGNALPLLDPPAALREAERIFGGQAGAVGPFDYDQWVVHNRFDPLRPFYRLDAGDEAGTQLYLSARTGELVQRTTRAERGWNWVGAVLHWAYVTPLRSNWAAWDQTVWWLSLVCLLVAVAGTILGIVRMMAARRLYPPRYSFYRRPWMRWHHLLGLGSALFVLSWMLSGWLSMDHGRLFSRGSATPLQAARIAGCPLAQAIIPIKLPALRRADEAKELTFSVLACRPLVTRFDGVGAVILNAEGAPVATAAFHQYINEAIDAAWPGAAPLRIEPVDGSSTFALAEGWPATALRLVPARSDLPDLYVDAQGGRLLTVMDQSRAAYAWVYYALHTFNVPGLSERPVLRRSIALVLLVIGFLFSVTGAMIGWQRLRRAVNSS